MWVSCSLVQVMESVNLLLNLSFSVEFSSQLQLLQFENCTLLWSTTTNDIERCSLCWSKENCFWVEERCRVTNLIPNLEWLRTDSCCIVADWWCTMAFVTDCVSRSEVEQHRTAGWQVSVGGSAEEQEHSAARDGREQHTLWHTQSTW